MSSSEFKAFAESVSQILELCMLRLFSYEDADVEQQEGEGEEDDALNQDERMIVVSHQCFDWSRGVYCSRDGCKMGRSGSVKHVGDPTGFLVIRQWMCDSHSCRPWGEDYGTDHAVGVWRTGRWREATNGQGRKAKCGQDNDALYDEIRESAGIGHQGSADQVRAVSSVLVSPRGEISVVWESDERRRGEKRVGDCIPGKSVWEDALSPFHEEHPDVANPAVCH